MKTAVICFADQADRAAALCASAMELSPAPVLWVLGELGDYPLQNTGAAKIFQLTFANEQSLSLPLCCAEALMEQFAPCPPDLILTPSGLRGDELASRLSQLLDGCFMADAAALSADAEGIIIQKTVYSGNLLGSFRCRCLPLCVSLTPSGKNPAPLCKAPAVTRLYSAVQPPAWLSELCSFPAARGSSLAEGEPVLCAGRGVGKAENFERLQELAQKLGGVLGGSRPTVSDGKLPASRLIGLSGSRISPKLCLTFGISGSAAFLAGIEASGRIIAVNKNPAAPIFENCDLGIVCDCNDLAKALLSLI